MRTRNIYILSACLAAVLSCTEFQEENIVVNEAEKVEMTFTASICDETASETKTVLDGQLGDELRKVLWTPGDEIGVVASNSTAIERFENTETANSETASFKGGAAIADTYYAAYPYSGLIWTEGLGYKAFIFELPQTQRYTSGSFGKDCAPMVAKAAYGAELQFKNLCGVLALNLTGEESVKSITFTGRDANGEAMYVSGKFVANMTYEDVPTMEPGSKFAAFSWPTNKSVTLECEEAVQLSPSEATPFYFVLPPATYETFTLLITTADGKVMMKEGTKPLTIKRSDVQPTADLAYVETTVIDLSLNGLANCYIVTGPGIYSLDATTIGNGDFGLIADAGFHTDNTSISPDSAELLWCEKEGSITGVSYDQTNGRITFMATGEEGNGVIAAKDADGNILWSWHIWMTDQPAEHVYVNSTGEYTVLDRNLGATRADRGTDDQWEESIGVLFQWGRKDPFIYHNTSRQTSGQFNTINESVTNPEIYVSNYGLWSSDMTDQLWSKSVKTIYDPCPAGYTVANTDVFNILTYGEYNENGSYFFYNDALSTTWYPSTPYIDCYGVSISTDNGYTWTSEVTYNTSEPDIFSYTLGSSPAISRNRSCGDAYPVRCMKESNTINLQLDEISNITSTSATFSGSVSASTSIKVTMKGFVYGTSEDITIENGTVIECGSGSGTFTADVSGLSIDQYYVRIYAKTSEGVQYSPTTQFIIRGGATEAENDMVFVVSANISNNFTVSLPTYGTTDCTVDWGDGNIENFQTTDTNISHTYNISSPSTYDVRISGTVSALRSYDNNSIIEVKQWGSTGLKSMISAFSGAQLLQTICNDNIGAFIEVDNFTGAWNECKKLQEIPQGLFKYARNAQDISSVFSHCTLIESIPERLFANCTSVTNIKEAFYGCTALTSIPSGLFDSFTNAKTFDGTFYDCSSITSIPIDLFENCTETENFNNCFRGCSSLTTIPEELFKNNVKATEFDGVFASCSSLTSIPVGLFSNLTNATTFNNSFSGCGIESLPTGLFKDTSAESFFYTFSGCDKLKTTNEVFEGCSKATDFRYAFRLCESLTTISENLFASCTSAKNFEGTFYRCTSLESIPASLFGSCTLAEYFNSTFWECESLTSIPVNLFDMTRRAKDFGQCFYLCGNLTGESPHTIIDGVKYHLYERANNIEQFVTPTYSYGCFGYCRGLTDYDSIPGDWK